MDLLKHLNIHIITVSPLLRHIFSMHGSGIHHPSRVCNSRGKNPHAFKVRGDCLTKAPHENCLVHCLTSGSELQPVLQFSLNHIPILKASKHNEQTTEQ